MMSLAHNDYCLKSAVTPQVGSSNECVCVFQYCNDVAQRYGTIAAHTRHCASVLLVFVVFCVHMYSFYRFYKADATADIQ